MRINGDELLRLALARYGTRAAFRRAIAAHEGCAALADNVVRDWFASTAWPTGPYVVAIERELSVRIADLAVDGEQPRKRVRP